MPIEIKGIKAIVYERCHEIRTTRDVADILGISPEILRRIFAREVGTPLSGFITSVRVEKAKQLLLQTDEPCQQICTSVGFPREEIGDRIFKRTTGMTMQEFRTSGKTSASQVGPQDPNSD